MIKYTDNSIPQITIEQKLDVYLDIFTAIIRSLNDIAE